MHNVRYTVSSMGRWEQRAEKVLLYLDYCLTIKCEFYFILPKSLSEESSLVIAFFS